MFNLSRVLLVSKVIAILLMLRLFLIFLKLQKILVLLAPKKSRAEADPELIQQIAHDTDALVGRLPSWVGSKCILRSLTLYYFATRCGCSVRFHCGIRRVSKGLEGHAWLSLNDSPFFEKEYRKDAYSVTFSFPEGFSEHFYRRLVRPN